MSTEKCAETNNIIITDCILYYQLRTAQKKDDNFVASMHFFVTDTKDAPLLRCIFCVSCAVVYLLMRSKRAMMAAICSRVALPCGWKVLSVKPVTMPFATAQATAGLA